MANAPLPKRKLQGCRIRIAARTPDQRMSAHDLSEARPLSAGNDGEHAGKETAPPGAVAGEIKAISDRTDT